MATLSYCYYELKPLQKLNRFQANKRQGVLLRLEDKPEKQGRVCQTVGYVDYHPWHELGDPSIDEVLHSLKHKQSQLSKYLVKSAQKDMSRDLDTFSNWSSFKNHCVLTPNQHAIDNKSNALAEVVKVKLTNDVPYEIERLKKIISFNYRLRLDANNGLSLFQFWELWNALSDSEQKMIEYIEDPTPFDYDTWNSINKVVAVALDRWPASFLSMNRLDSAMDLSTCFDYVILKPNILAAKDLQQLKLNKPVIFSSYMGHDLGRIHCYFELVEHGDLELVHGINTPALYFEQTELFQSTGVHCTPVKENFKKVYQNLERLEWRHLCQLS